MPATQRGPSTASLLVLPAFLSWALVATGIIVRHPALKTARPAAESFPARRAAGEQRVPARLWQDPLATAYEARDALRQSDGDDEGGRRAVPPGAPGPRSAPARGRAHDSVMKVEHVLNRFRGTGFAEQEFLLLPVFLSGQSYAEDAENRLRTRYAVLAGLSVAGYVPEDRRHIGYFTLLYRPPATDGHEALAARELIVPFEWYQRDSQPNEDVPQNGASSTQSSRAPWRTVLVLWIDEDHFGPDHLHALGELLRNLCRDVRGVARQHPGEVAAPLAAEGSDGPLPAVRVLGPTNSNALLDILTKFDEQHLHPFRVTIYSPWATIPSRTLTQELESRGSGAGAPDILEELHVERTLADDEVICSSLVRELELRREPSIPAHQMNVALIAEWDTAYGRALPRAFKRLYCRKKDETGTGGPQPTPRVRLFSYLQGIDGRLPGEQLAARGARPDTIAVTERPEGSVQLDYARRLEQQLQEYDARLQREGHGRLRAIGVLGSDVYDKLLILRAIRPRFPAAIFFTTDLDAILLDPNEQKWTRNLVVASAFGLRLCRDLQDPVLPFRGSYQTSIFFATLRLLGRVRWPADRPPPQARVFEIGRSSPYELPVEEQGAVWPHPDGQQSRGWWMSDRKWQAALTAVPALVLALLVARTARVFVRSVLRGHRERRITSLVIGLTALAALGALAYCIYHDQGNPEREPLALFEGVSIWPTELIRVLGALVSCCCCYIVWSEFGRDTEDIERALSSSQTDHLPQRGFLRSAWRSVANIFEHRQDWKHLGELWAEYHERRSVASRLGRTTLFLLAYMATAYGLFSLLGFPTVPGRGTTSFIADCAVIIFSVLAMMVLLFLVLQRTQLCVWFVRQMGAGPAGAWPDDARTEWLKSRKLPQWQPASDLDEWLNVRLIAAHTEPVSRFIYYPFVVMLILVVARHPVFDRWDWPMALVIVIGLVFVVELYASVLLRRAAQRARATAVTRLRERLLALRETGPRQRVETTEQLLKDIEAERGGALSPTSESPVIRSLLIPSGGLGTLAALEYAFGFL